MLAVVPKEGQCLTVHARGRPGRLAAMFLLPLLPDWLYEGPRTSKHWLGRHCLATARSRDRRAHLHPRESEAGPVLRGQLRRLA
jgi:hypothetical protein